MMGAAVSFLLASSLMLDEQVGISTRPPSSGDVVNTRRLSTAKPLDQLEFLEQRLRSERDAHKRKRLATKILALGDQSARAEMNPRFADDIALEIARVRRGQSKARYTSNSGCCVRLSLCNRTTPSAAAKRPTSSRRWARDRCPMNQSKGLSRRYELKGG